MFWLAEGISALLALALPFALAAWLARRHGSRWGLFWAGAVTFAASQVVHLPLNSLLARAFATGWLPVPAERYQLVFNATLAGLTAGLCEESARYLVLRLWQRRARGWRAALMFGAGHGGLEAMLVAGLIVATMLQLAYYSQQNLAALGLPAEAVEQIRQALAVWNTSPAYLGLVPALERILAICLHLGLSVMVMRAVTRRNLGWLLAAIVWHTLANAVAVYVAVAAGPDGKYLAEIPVAVFALAGLGLIWLLREPAPAPERPEPAPGVPAAPVTDVVAEAARRLAGAPGQEQLEQTRYE